MTFTMVLDLDDTTCVSVGKVIELYNREFGTEHHIEEFKEWNLAKFATPEIYKYYNQPGLHFFRDLPLEENALEVLTKLHQEGVKIVVATSVRPENKEGAEDKRHWVETYLKGLVTEVHITTDKSNIKGDVIIDDGIHNLSTSPCTYKIVYDRPWNRSVEDFIRVHNWLEVYETIKKLREESV